MADFRPNPAPTAILTCAVLEIELRHFTQSLGHIVHLEVLEQGLHDEPDKLRAELQAAVDRVERDTDAQAILLGYGLCSRGIEGVRANRCRIVVPRAHDCITVLLGSKERYAAYVADNPGTYWYSPGWNRSHIPPGPERYRKRYEEYVAKYGQDNAEYLMEAEQGWFSSYNRATYVELTVGATEQDIDYTKRCADWLNWSFDHQHGDPKLVQDLLTGPWDEERFLVLEPGQTARMTADERIIEAVDARPDAST